MSININKRAHPPYRIRRKIPFTGNLHVLPLGAYAFDGIDLWERINSDVLQTVPAVTSAASSCYAANKEFWIVLGKQPISLTLFKGELIGMQPGLPNLFNVDNVYEAAWELAPVSLPDFDQGRAIQALFQG